MFFHRARRAASLIAVVPDEDSSISSTVQVHSPVYVGARKDNRAWKGTASLVPPKLKKHVRFNEDANKAYASTTHAEKEDCKALWYSNDDFASFRKEVNKLAQQVAQAERSNASSNSYSNAVMSTFQACVDCPFETRKSILTTDEEKRLKRSIAQVSLSRLGLDQYIFTVLRQDFWTRRQRLLDAVFLVQGEKYTHICEAFRNSLAEPSLCSNRLDEQAFALRIRRASLDISRPARLFARHMAQAREPAQDNLAMQMDSEHGVIPPSYN